MINRFPWWSSFCGATVVGLLLLARLDPAGAAEISYPCLDKVYTHSVLTAAHAKVVRLYAVDPISQECRRAGELKEFPLEGKARINTSSRLWVQNKNGQLNAIMGYRGPLLATNQPVLCMVYPARSPTISVNDVKNGVLALPQYIDVTMHLADFVGFLRNGFHFPEAPELGTRPNRRRLFSTERIKGSKVEQIRNEQKATPPVAPPKPVPADPYGQTNPPTAH